VDRKDVKFVNSSLIVMDYTVHVATLD
jgi:hypothetical protein